MAFVIEEADLNRLCRRLKEWVNSIITYYTTLAQQKIANEADAVGADPNLTAMINAAIDYVQTVIKDRIDRELEDFVYDLLEGEIDGVGCNETAGN